MTTNIVLEGKTYEISAPRFKNLRLLIAAFNRLVKAGTDSNTTAVESGIIIGLLIEKTVEEVDEMRITMTEMTAAMNCVPDICGLKMGEKKSGEVPVAAEAVTALTASTAT